MDNYCCGMSNMRNKRRLRAIVLVVVMCSAISLPTITSGELTQPPPLPQNPSVAPINISTLGSQGWIYPRDSIPDGQGGFYVGGSMNGPVILGNITIPSSSHNRAYIAHVNSNGVWDWIEALSGSDWSETQALEIGPAGSVYAMIRSRDTFVIQGHTFNSTNNDDFVAIAHFDSSGTLSAKAVISDTSGSNGRAYPIEIQADGYYVYAMIYGHGTIGSGNVSVTLSNNYGLGIFKISMVSGDVTWGTAVTATYSVQRTLPTGGTESRSSRVEGFSLGLDNSNNRLTVHGYIESHADFSSTTSSSITNVEYPLYSDLRRNFVASLNTNGTWGWITSTTYSAHQNMNYWASGNIWNERGLKIPINSQTGESYVLMRHSDNRSFGVHCHSQNAGWIVFKFNDIGECNGYVEISTTTSNINLRAFDLSQQGEIVVGGTFWSNTITIGNETISSSNNVNGMHYSSSWAAKFDASGNTKWTTALSASGYLEIYGVHINPTNDVHLMGRVDGSSHIGNLPIPSNSSTIFILELDIDTDGDGYADLVDSHPLDSSQYRDSDGDGYGDNSGGYLPDSCPTINGNSSIDMYGCVDTDGDGMADGIDPFPRDRTQWSDIDGDGYGDNLTGFRGDECPEIPGFSYIDKHGCPDSDQDGWSDENDLDPNDPYQSGDSDGDGYGDNPTVVGGDSCPLTYGNSTIDKIGCPDSDGDGWSDSGDAYPNDPNAHADTDGDGIADYYDAFPLNPTQWSDVDGDGCGDNPLGLNPDLFIDDAERCYDIDNDGVSDFDDAFPNDPTQWSDVDGDGCGDNPLGLNPDLYINDEDRCNDLDNDGVADYDDPFPNDPTQWSDDDGDGYGDNVFGRNPDAFTNDSTQWSDIDGDGFGDNMNGSNPDWCFIRLLDEFGPCILDRDNDGWTDDVDMFPDEPTQWIDEDLDGYGDNQSGRLGDPFPNDKDNDGCFDPADPAHPQLPEDYFPNDPRECFDTDGDGIGNNKDEDDDNDGFSDLEEIELGTDSLDANSTPSKGFEMLIPGTSATLDIYGLMGIVFLTPVILWLIIGFYMRGNRSKRLENELQFAQGKLSSIQDELKAMQNELENTNQLRDDISSNSNTNDELSHEYLTPVASIQGVVGDDGWEWLNYPIGTNQQFHRPADSNEEWVRWEGEH